MLFFRPIARLPRGDEGGASQDKPLFDRSHKKRARTTCPGARSQLFQFFPLVLLMTLRRVNSSRSRSSSTPEIKRIFSSNFGMFTSYEFNP